MSFQPTPYLDCHICEIEILATANISSNTTAINLGNILIDTGGQITVASNFITFPANMEFFVKSNLVCQSVNGGTTITLAYTTFKDASNNPLQYQATGQGAARTGANSGTSFQSTDCFMCLFSSASARSAKLTLDYATAEQPTSIPYNSATSYIPNSTITILYK